MALSKKVKQRIFTVFFMFAVSVFFIGIISAVYLATKKTVIRNESLFIKRSVLYTAGITPPEAPSEIEAVFSAKVTEFKDGKGKAVYYTVSGDDGGKVFVMVANGRGLWGEIAGHIGLDNTLTKITGIDFTLQSETPGLGARIAEDWFREQFRGMTGPVKRVAEGTKDNRSDEFDAITGATITTVAVEKMVNGTLEKAQTVVSGGEK